jgi:hypothetical protein
MKDTGLRVITLCSSKEHAPPYSGPKSEQGTDGEQSESLI